MTILSIKCTVNQSHTDIILSVYCAETLGHTLGRKPISSRVDYIMAAELLELRVMSSAMFEVFTSEYVIESSSEAERCALDGYFKDLLRYEAGNVCRWNWIKKYYISEEDPVRNLDCEETTQLHFHHWNEKRQWLGQIRLPKEPKHRSRFVDTMRTEAKQCILLCRRHHCIVHE